MKFFAKPRALKPAQLSLASPRQWEAWLRCIAPSGVRELWWAASSPAWYQAGSSPTGGFGTSSGPKVLELMDSKRGSGPHAGSDPGADLQQGMLCGGTGDGGVVCSVALSLSAQH